MPKSKEELAEARERRFTVRVQAIAENMVPAKHLSIWARVRSETGEDVSPSEVWRALMEGVTYKYDPETSMFFISNHTNNKEG